MKSGPQIAVMDGGKMRPFSTVAHDDALREALVQAMQAQGHVAVREASHTRRIVSAAQYVIIPAEEMKDHVLLIGGGNVSKYAVRERVPHASAVDGWMQVLTLMPDLPVRLSKRAAELSEERIQLLLDVMLDVDPFEPIEARIDGKNAEMRAEFLKDFPVLDSAGVHKLAGLKGTNTSQTVNAWRRKGRILGLPVHGRNAYPVFQFDADGQPLALMELVLAALPDSFTAWQRAFWLVSPKEALDGETPVDAVKAGDDRVVETARGASELVAG